MKTNMHRIKVMTALNKPRAYALYNGFIESEFIGGTGLFMGKAMMGGCMASAFIAPGKAPRALRDKYMGQVWRITDKGRDWLAQAKRNVDFAPERFVEFGEKKKVADAEWDRREKLRAKQSELAKANIARLDGDGNADGR